ncbi:SigE family RNA polymerase sigma factor [Streptomyces sp. NPDC051940]|uniref:SigE family RNA polymerase sigma factor n=1 Tax=Streptomyces sp. NPDC051940 TaxID=3155675 RepID=UPI00341301CB
MDAKEQEEFREFVSMRSTALLRLAVLLTGGDRHAAEDLLQTALMKSYGRWRRIEQPEAYVRQVMYRHQVSRWRLRLPHAETVVAAPPEPDGGHRPDTAREADERLLVRQALTKLTPRQRAVLVLRYCEDMPERDVAGVLGCSVGTVRSTAFKALEKLRRLAPELSPFAGSESLRRSVTGHSPEGARP